MEGLVDLEGSAPKSSLVPSLKPVVHYAKQVSMMGLDFFYLLHLSLAYVVSSLWDIELVLHVGVRTLQQGHQRNVKTTGSTLQSLVSSH